MVNWKQEIERIKQDSEFTDQQKKNLIAYYQLQEYIEESKRKEKEKQRLKARCLRLLKTKRRLAEKLKETEKEFSKLLYDDNVFSYFERRRFILKHEERRE